MPEFQWVGGIPVAIVALDLYEIVNLREAIRAIGYPSYDTDGKSSPLDVLNSGDWIGQLYQKLPDPGALSEYDANRFPARPNRTAENYREAARTLRDRAEAPDAQPE